MRLLLVLLATLLLAACGGEQAVVFDPVGVAKTTSGAASARVDMDVRAELTGDNLTAAEAEEVAAMNFSAAGAIGEHGRLMQLTYTMAARTLGLEREGDVTFDAVLDTVTGIMYFDAAAFGLELPEGKSWVSVKSDELQGLQRTNDPSQLVTYLYAAGDLERVGEGTVRGVKTTKYKATVDLDRAIETYGGELREKLEEALDAVKSIGVESIPMEVWIDDGNYLRRVDMDWRVENQYPKQELHLRIHMELWDFGADVGIEVPAKSQTIDLDELGG